MIKQSKLVKEMEYSVAEALGGRRTPLSGAGNVKGDGRVLGTRDGGTGSPGGSAGYRIECKWTADVYYRLTYDTWLKLVRAANEAHEEPIFVIRVCARDRIRRTDFAVIRVGLAKRLGILKRSTEIQAAKPSWKIVDASDPTHYFLGDGVNYESLALVMFGDLAHALTSSKTRP